MSSNQKDQKMTHHSDLSDGDKCPECKTGTLVWEHPDDCSCHLSPPCAACTSAPLTCDNCGQEYYGD